MKPASPPPTAASATAAYSACTALVCRPHFATPWAMFARLRASHDETRSSVRFASRTSCSSCHRSMHFWPSLFHRFAAWLWSKLVLWAAKSPSSSSASRACEMRPVSCLALS